MWHTTSAVLLHTCPLGLPRVYFFALCRVVQKAVSGTLIGFWVRSGIAKSGFLRVFTRLGYLRFFRGSGSSGASKSTHKPVFHSGFGPSSFLLFSMSFRLNLDRGHVCSNVR